MGKVGVAVGGGCWQGGMPAKKQQQEAPEYLVNEGHGRAEEVEEENRRITEWKP